MCIRDRVILVALFLTVQLEGNLLNPFILGKAVQIHPLGILVAVQQLIDDLTNTITENRASLAQGVFSTANRTLAIVGGAVFCLFATLFLLTDDGGIWRWVVRLFPWETRAKVAHAGTVAWRTLIAYMRSTVLLALINALTMVVVMLIAGMPLVVPLGVLLFL